MDKAQFLIGIDAGGTKTQACLWEMDDVHRLRQNSSSETEIMRTARWSDTTGGLNLDAVDHLEARWRLAGLLERASQKVGLPLSNLLAKTQVVFGLAGLDTAHDKLQAQQWLEVIALTGGWNDFSFNLIPDVELALWAAGRRGSGIVLLAGTGSNCYGRLSSGHTFKTGGMSEFFSDEGSGFMLGWQALHAIGQMQDGRRSTTALLGQILAAYNVTNFAELKSLIVTATDKKKIVAQAAPVVQALAEQGEKTAHQIVDNQIKQLVLMVTTVWERLTVQGRQSTAQFPVYLVGGTLQNEYYRRQLQTAMQMAGLTGEFRYLQNPVIGAVFADFK